MDGGGTTKGKSLKYIVASDKDDKTRQYSTKLF